MGATLLVKTKWSQRDPYNWKSPSSTCSGGYYLAGCGAIAASQVIAYYGKYKTKYDFASLTTQPTITTSSSNYLKDQVSSFVESVGEGIKSRYGCDVTISYTTDTYSFFKNLGYNISKPINKHDSYELRKTLESKNLVLCRGTSDSGGHIWVIDGFRQYLTYCSPSYVHCNWGWGGNSDGWYYDVAELLTNPAYVSYVFKYDIAFMYINENK